MTVGDRLAIQDGEKTLDPITGAPIKGDNAGSITLNNVLRAKVATAAAAGALRSPDHDARAQAIDTMLQNPSPAFKTLIEQARQKETDPTLRKRLDQLWAQTALHDTDAKKRREAIDLIAAAGDPQMRDLLLPIVAKQADGAYAEPEEMVALCNVVKRYNGGYFTHIRDESNKVLEAVEEAIHIAETCRIHVEIVHFKCSGLDNWGKAATALKMIAAAKARGLDIDCDSHPYTAGSNPLKNLMPQWVQAGGVPAMLERLALSETRERIRADIARDGLNNWGRIPDWDCVQISISPHLPQFAGRTIKDLAAERGKDPIDVVCDYMIEDQGATRVLVIS
ncbi:MAG: hypothetical protein J0I36_14125, partial [Pandoraea sp.]|nr:hypothetical protein [Pandoraea sp.]